MAGIGADSPASTSSRNASVWRSSVASKAKPRELPARGGREEVAIGGAAVPARGRAARSLQHELPAHKLAVIFADCACRRSEAGVGSEGALSPFPYIAENPAAGARKNGAGQVELVADHRVGRGGEILPLALGRKARTGPAGEGVRLEKADVRDGRGPIDLASACQGEFILAVAPVEGRRDLFALNPVPSLGEPKRGRRITAIIDELAPFP